MIFSTEEIEKLNEGFLEVDRKYHQFLESVASKKFKTSEADEFAKHGFLRRLKTLSRCIKNIYKICPPNHLEKLSADALSDVTINLQAFIFNIYGCLDNLAWVWTKEKELINEERLPLKSYQIGFGKKYIFIRKSFSDHFQQYIEGYVDWFDYLNDFRHALAHRIPLYIPPYVLSDDEAKKEKELEEIREKLLKEHNFEEYKKLSIKLNNLGKFRPWMTHSYSEKAKIVVFHAQIISDWNTIIEIADKLFVELENS